jgi:NADH:ubiquinone oxidoreductase subunit E
MVNNKNTYLKTDDNKIINEKCIKWVKQMENCLEVCTMSPGCIVNKNTHRVCKDKSYESYMKLISFFE